MRQRLIVFTRIPDVGRNKTRLIPALGAEGATSFHERLARHAIGRASAFVMRHPGTELEIRVTGGSKLDGRAWLGDANWKVQNEGDLGDRLYSAVEEAFDDGVGKVVLIGSDCPRLSESELSEAFEALGQREVVIGPALDGGYYLIGVAKSESKLFDGVEWGGPNVFQQTMKKAEEMKLSRLIMRPLPDVDLPGDLEEAERALVEGRRVSVIIPALNEDSVLEATLDRVNRGSPWEVLVADGGSSDGTKDIAVRKGARLIDGARGRAAQMNLAAKSATGEYLLFLHADTLPPDGYTRIVSDALARPGVAAGAFGLSLDEGVAAAELIERLVALRCRWLGTPYGDQGLFIRRSVFAQIEGFPDEPVMEDLAMVRKLGQFGVIVVVAERALSSGRRWRSEGVIRTFLRHQVMLAAHYLGLSSRIIARMR